MAFLRTLFWIVITVIVVVFSIRNWTPVTINLFGDVQADVKLPALLLIVFLLGFLPLYAWHKATRWRHKRQLGTIERTPAPVVSTPAATVAPPTSAPAPTSIDPFQAD